MGSKRLSRGALTRVSAYHRPGRVAWAVFLWERFMLLGYLIFRFAMPRYFAKQRDEDESWMLGAEAWVPVELGRR